MAASVHIVLLAAGRSSRTGASHKLLATFDGTPLIRRSAIVALGSKAAGVTIVTGYRAAEIANAVNGLPVRIVENPRWADGLSTSLVAGFEAAPPDAGGILVMLADQPLLESAHLDRLVEVFQPTGEGSLVTATDNGQRFNPCIISRSYEPEIKSLSGDIGARKIIERHPDMVRSVEIGQAASCDADTLESILAAGGVPEKISPKP